jgi:hypothetical protein
MQARKPFMGIEPNSNGIRRAAALMHEAHGPFATAEAASRALAHRRRGDEIGFDVWSGICAALHMLDERAVAESWNETVY